MGAVVADLFAGRGRFEDGSEGSPLVIARQVRIYNDRLGYKNQLILAEEIEADREQLRNACKEFIDANITTIIAGDAQDAGEKLMDSIKAGVPLFVFLDPFGIRGLSIELLKKILQRAKKDSTELLVNFNHRGLPRLAGICKHLTSENDKLRKQATSVYEMAKQVFGGDWWLEVMNNPELAEEERSLVVLKKYAALYKSAFRWLVEIPVSESFLHEGKPKYFLIFGSRSVVALELMNDCVNRARRDLAKVEMAKGLLGTLFEQTDPEQFIKRSADSDIGQLKSLTLSEITGYCTEQGVYTGNTKSVIMHRQIIRSRLIEKQFANYSTSEINESISCLLASGEIISENGRTRISDDVCFKLN